MRDKEPAGPDLARAARDHEIRPWVVAPGLAQIRALCGQLRPAPAHAPRFGLFLPTTLIGLLGVPWRVAPYPNESRLVWGQICAHPMGPPILCGREGDQLGSPRWRQHKFYFRFATGLDHRARCNCKVGRQRGATSCVAVELKHRVDRPSVVNSCPDLADRAQVVDQRRAWPPAEGSKEGLPVVCPRAWSRIGVGFARKRA